MARLICYTETDYVMNASSSPIVVPFSDDELDELADFLDSDAVPADAMDISMLHGFLTALALSPETASPEVWMPLVWGEDGAVPTFSTPTQQTHIESLVHRLHGHIAATLSHDAGNFMPILYVDEEDKLDISRPWCHGFTQGVWLQEEAWAPMFESDESGALLEPVFDCADEEARAELEAEGEDLAEWEHTIASALTDIVVEIKAFHRQKQ